MALTLRLPIAVMVAVSLLLPITANEIISAPLIVFPLVICLDVFNHLFIRGRLEVMPITNFSFFFFYQIVILRVEVGNDQHCNLELACRVISYWDYS